MLPNTKSIERYYSELVFITIMLLFFLQLFSDYVESTYILLLMTLSLNQNILVLLFMFSPVILLLFRRNIPDGLLVIAGGLLVVCRVLEPLFETTPRMILSGLGVGCFLIFFPAFLLTRSTDEKNQRALMVGKSLALAIAASILLRTLNYTIDLSTYGFWQAIGWVLAVVEIAMLFGFSSALQIKAETPSPALDETATSQRPIRKRRLAGITFGLTSILFFVGFAFSSPGVISRWTESSYILVVTGVALMTSVFALLMVYKPQIIGKLQPRFIVLWNLLFVALFVLMIIVNQIPFPDIPGSYPIEAPPTTLLHHSLLCMMIAAYPIILVDFVLLSYELIKLEIMPSSRAAGISFTLGGGTLLLALLFTLILTSVWGFVPVIGPMLRDLFWFIFLIAGILLLVAIYFARDSIPIVGPPSKTVRIETIAATIVVLMLVGTMTSLVMLEARPAAPSGDATSLRILTYNIAQGMNDVDNKNYDGQLELIREIDADIIGLQETSKIAGNSDVVRYFADQLNLHSYFGPKGVTGTTGVALLSKYPIENARTIYHYAEDVDRKQTATIEAEITVGTRTFTVYVTHTSGRTSAKVILQNDILDAAAGKSNVIFMGDFNFRPNTEPYNITTVVLDDSWWVRWPTGINGQGEDNSNRIDLIFLSPGTTVSDCLYVTDPQSDHPAYWADIQW
ncbi:MAG: endonuclease/exonuclease/phosphatase family protein [Candidatus Thorarchaeota archaeon]|jgi:endonuclease/exonuclease/phosphatase family metal-dependent hydrolase